MFHIYVESNLSGNPWDIKITSVCLGEVPAYDNERLKYDANIGRIKDFSRLNRTFICTSGNNPQYIIVGSK